MAKRGTPLPIPLRLKIKEQTAAGAKVKPLARAVGVDPKTVRKYRQK